jgi:hypothetical protein
VNDKNKETDTRTVKNRESIDLGMAEYMGGQAAYPKHEVITIKLHDDRMEIDFTKSKSWLEVPYSNITGINNTSKKKISLRWAIFLGILFLPLVIIPLIWKKKLTYTRIDFKKNSIDQYLVIDFDRNLKFAQRFLNKKMGIENNEDKGKD